MSCRCVEAARLKMGSAKRVVEDMRSRCVVDEF